MSRLINAVGSFFPKLQKDFKIYGGDVFTEVYDGDFYKDLPFDKYIKFNTRVPQENVYYIRDFGAIPNADGINNAKCINKAISFCSENGGGTVMVDGGRFTTGTVFLKSNVMLYIDKNSALVASHNPDDFCSDFLSGSRREDFIPNSLIFAENCENIAI
ncbi:MAG: hypothetical protein ACI4N4_00215, partial [Candidatus Fimenecus sp.]